MYLLQVPCVNVFFVIAETVAASGAVTLIVGFVFLEEVSPALTVEPVDADNGLAFVTDIAVESSAVEFIEAVCVVDKIFADLLVNDVFVGLAGIIVGDPAGGETAMLGVEKVEEF